MATIWPRNFPGGSVVLIILMIAFPVHAEKPQVAVADFESAGPGLATADPAFGLADLLAMELQHRGVVLWERQQMRLILGERRLNAKQLLAPARSAAQLIPGLDFLGTGRVRLEADQSFQLETSWVEARSGRNAASFSASGKSAGELATALGSVAGEMSAWLAAQASATVPAGPGRTRVNHKPEVSLLFYRGVAYCLAGEPELGVTWFIDANKADPANLAARFWTMRAYEMIGLPDFAAVARRKIEAAPGGRTLLNQLRRADSVPRGAVAVAVMADPRLDSAGLKFRTQLTTALGMATNLFVVDPGNIHALAAEMDLQLAELGGRELELSSVLWSTVAALVLVRGEAGAGRYDVELHDATSGEVRFRTQAEDSATGIQQTGALLAKQINAARAGDAATRSGTGFRTKPATKPRQVSNTDRDEFAGLLRYLAANDADREAWLRLSLFIPWLTGREDGAYERVMFDRVIAATDLAQPDAAHWLSEALWRKHAYGGISSFAKEAAVLLHHFPKTPEGCYVRSALALEMIDHTNYAGAVEIFVQLAEELPRLPASVKIEPDYWANFYFFTAVALRETGDETRAREFLARAAAVLRANPDLLIHDGNTYQLGVWVNHFPGRHPLFGVNRDIRQAVSVWELQLNPVTFANGRDMSVEQLELLLTQTKQMAGAAAWTNRVTFLQRLSEHQQAHPELYSGRLNESTYRGAYREVEAWPVGWMSGNFSLPGKLVMEATSLLHRMSNDSPERLPELRALAVQVARGLQPQIAANCYEAVGDFTTALQLVTQALQSPASFPETPNIRPTPVQTATRALRGQKIRLLQKMGQAEAAATFALQQAKLAAADAGEHWSAVVDAAAACDTAGWRDRSRELFQAFVRQHEAAGAVTAQTAAARIAWADGEAAADNVFAATEILRAVVKASEGKNWGVYLRTGYADAYDAAVTRLAKLRAVGSVAAGATVAGATDWARWNQRSRPAPSQPPRDRSPLEEQLDTILRGRDTGAGGRSFGGPELTEFAKQYGRAAVPAILDAAQESESNARLIGSLRILERVATAEDAPAVLAAFKQIPYLAVPAFALDRTNAAAILTERFSIYAQGGNLPRELRQVIGQYALTNTFPVLIAHLVAKNMDGNTFVIARELDGLLRTNGSPALVEKFRPALAAVVERHLLANYHYGLATLGEIALRRGWPEGIETLLQARDPALPEALSCLRKYLDLPADDRVARAEVEAHLGNWQWNAAAGKFVVAPPAVAPARTGASELPAL